MNSHKVRVPEYIKAIEPKGLDRVAYGVEVCEGGYLYYDFESLELVFGYGHEKGENKFIGHAQLNEFKKMNLDKIPGPGESAYGLFEYEPNPTGSFILSKMTNNSEKGKINLEYKELMIKNWFDLGYHAEKKLKENDPIKVSTPFFHSKIVEREDFHSEHKNLIDRLEGFSF